MKEAHSDQSLLIADLLCAGQENLKHLSMEDAQVIAPHLRTFTMYDDSVEKLKVLLMNQQQPVKKFLMLELYKHFEAPTINHVINNFSSLYVPEIFHLLCRIKNPQESFLILISKINPAVDKVTLLTLIDWRGYKEWVDLLVFVSGDEKLPKSEVLSMMRMYISLSLDPNGITDEFVD